MFLGRLSNLLAFTLFVGSAAGLRADVLAYASAENSSGRSSSFGLLDLTTGAFSQIATLNNIFLNDLALSSNGTLYMLDVPITGTGAAEFGTINPSTGAITDIATNTVSLNTMGFNSSGMLYGTTYTTSGPEALYTVNPATGAASFIADLSGPISTVANQLRFIGDTAYTTSYTTPSGLYTINLTTGAGTLVGNTGLNQYNGLGGVVNGQLVDTASTTPGAAIFDINPATGATTEGATTDRTYAFTLLETPEPGTAVLVGCALACLIALRRRRSSAAGRRPASGW